MKEINLSQLPSEPMEVRLYHANNVESEPAVLRALSNDCFWYVRDFVASNISTPEECLHQLLRDPDARVRAEAERTLSRQAALRQSAGKLPLKEQLAAASARQLNPSTAPEPAHTR